MSLSFKHVTLNSCHYQLELSPPSNAAPNVSEVIPRSISAKFAPSCWYRTKADCHWLICGFDGRPFGGLYYRRKVDYILNRFEGWCGPITPSIFSLVAERAVNLRNQRFRGSSMNPLLSASELKTLPATAQACKTAINARDTIDGLPAALKPQLQKALKGLPVKVKRLLSSAANSQQGRVAA